MKIRILGILLAAIMLLTLTCSSALATYPEKPIELYVGYAAGGASDISARLIAPFLEKYLGQAVAVVNMPGGGGEIAYTELANAKPDGYILAFINAPATISIPLAREANYTLDDFAFIGNVIYHENLIAVRPDGDIQSLEDLLEKAKAKPGEVTMGNSGPFADDHLASLAFQDAAGIELNDTAFSGTAPSLIALLGGHIDAVVCNVADVVGKLDQVKIIATMGAEANPLFDAPTLVSKGYNVVMGNYTTLGAPAKTSEEVLTILRDAMEKACNDPEYIQKATDANLPIVYLNAEEVTKAYQDSRTLLEELWVKLDLSSIVE